MRYSRFFQSNRMRTNDLVKNKIYYPCVNHINKTYSRFLPFYTDSIEKTYVKHCQRTSTSRLLLTERRQRHCHENQKVEIQLRHVKQTEERLSLRNYIAHRFRRNKRRQLKLPSKINKLVAEDLKTTNAKFVVAIGTKVQLSCSTTGQAAIQKKYPKANHTWILNDVKLNTNKTRMKGKGLKLEISNITPNDQGLYTCRIYYTKKQGKTVYFATLITKNIGIPKEILETNTLKMRCPSSPIGRLFRKSLRDWSLNGKRQIADIPAKRRAFERFHNASKNYEGLWTCRVVDKSSKRIWAVIQYQISIKLLPPPENKYKTFIWKHPVLIGTQSFGVLGLIIVVYIALCHTARKKKNNVIQEIRVIEDDQSNEDSEETLTENDDEDDKSTENDDEDDKSTENDHENDKSTKNGDEKDTSTENDDENDKSTEKDDENDKSTENDDEKDQLIKIDLQRK